MVVMFCRSPEALTVGERVKYAVSTAWLQVCSVCNTARPPWMRTRRLLPSPLPPPSPEVGWDNIRKLSLSAVSECSSECPSVKWCRLRLPEAAEDDAAPAAEGTQVTVGSGTAAGPPSALTSADANTDVSAGLHAGHDPESKSSVYGATMTLEASVAVMLVQGGCVGCSLVVAVPRFDSCEGEGVTGTWTSIRAW